MIDRSKANFGGSPASAWRARLDLAPADAGGAPTVSIVTPCRDGGAASFFETLEAVRGQSLQAFEWLLLVDPATPAHWGERIAELAARDPRLRVLEQREPLAAGAALAAAATQARAELVALLAPDEVLEPTALETLAACLSADPELGFARGLAVVHGDRHLLLGEDEGGAPAETVPARLMLRRDRLAALLKADPEAADARDLRALLERLAEHGVRGVVVREHLHWIPWRDPGRPRPPAPGACVFAPSSVLVTPGPDLPLVANPLKRRRKRLVAIVPRIASEASGAVFTFALQILGRLGWQITAVALHAGEEGAETALARLTPDLHVLERAVHPEEWPRQLRGLLESRRPEIVLFDGARLPPALLFHLRAHVPETRYVALHHLDPDEPPAHGTARPLGAPDGADVTLASGIEPAADEHSGSLLWLPICVDTQVWQPRAGPRGWLRPNWGAGEDDAVILFVGSLADRDRLDRVLRSLAGLRERSVGFVAVIAGEGSEASGLASEIAKRGLSDCVRVPPDGSQDVLRAMAAADVFFSPGRTGFAIRFVQAMAMELPVVAADAAGRRALVTGECGRLVAPGAGEISGYVDALATLAADPSLRRDLGREARRRVLLRFGPDRLAQQLEAAFRDAVPRAADPSPTPALHLAAVEASRRAADHEALGRCAARLARESAALAAQRAALAGDLDRERAERSALEARQAELARAFEQRGRELREAKESLEALRGAPAALAGHPAGQDERLPLARDRQGFAARWWRPRRLARRVSGIARSLGRLDGGERTP